MHGGQGLSGDELYHERLLALARVARASAPFPEEVTHRAELFNPVCGDRVEVALSIASGIIRRIRVCVMGCAICEASAGLLLQRADGGKVPDLMALGELVESWFDDSAMAPPIAGFEVMTPVKLTYRNRILCACLPFQATREALAPKRERSCQ